MTGIDVPPPTDHHVTRSLPYHHDLDGDNSAGVSFFKILQVLAQNPAQEACAAPTIQLDLVTDKTPEVRHIIGAKKWRLRVKPRPSDTEPPVKILYSHRTRSADGQAVHIEGLTKALAAMGHDVRLVGPEGVTSPERHHRPLNAGREAKGGARPSLPPRLYELAEWGYSLPAFSTLLREKRRFEPDILYERYNLYYHAGAWAAGRQPFLLEVNAPLVDERTRHGGLAWQGFARSSEAKIWCRADAVLPVTQVLANRIAEAGISEDRLHVIPNGVDGSALVPGDRSAVRQTHGLGDAVVLGFVGFVRDWHGVDRVIDWLATPKGKDALLVVVGDGPAIPALLSQAERLSVRARVTVTGVVQRDGIRDYIAAIDVALQPAAVAYASPLKLQEYMAQARPVIAPDQPNIREVVTHDQDAWLVTPGDRDALFDALDRLVADEGQRQRLGAAAKATIERRNMTWAGNAERVSAIAQGLL